MRIANRQMGIPAKAVGLMICAALALATSAAGTEAATPAPGLKSLGVSLPTNLPPRQSEVQRLTVEAEGGSFALEAEGGEGKISPVVRTAIIATEKGKSVATIKGGEALELGARVIGAGLPFFEEAFVIACSDEDCAAPGSTVTFSRPSSLTSDGAEAYVQTKTAIVEAGSFAVGDEIRGSEAEYFAPGTLVTAVSGSTIGLSKPSTSECPSCSEILVSIFQRTNPIAYDADPSAVQGALQGLPALGAGAVAVSGGPGGDAAHPYYFAFGGKFENQDVPLLLVDESGLVGSRHFTKILTTVPGGNGGGEIVVLPSNIGALSTKGRVTATVGPLPAGILTAGKAEGIGWRCPGGAGETTVTCTTGHVYEALRASPATSIGIPIEVASPAPQGSRSPVLDTTVPVELSGGGSAPSVYPLHLVVSKQPAPFGISAAWGGSFEADGSPATQAGGHPYDAAAYFIVNSVRLTNGLVSPAGDSKNVVVDLPQGFTGNPLAGPRCPQSLVFPQTPSDLCNDSDTVGNLDPIIGSPTESLEFPARLYNDVPPQGVAAEFTTQLLFPFQSVVAAVNSEEDFGIRLTAPNNPNYEKIYGAFTAFEGVPTFGNGQALLSNATNCAESAAKAPAIATTANTFQDPATFGAFDIPQPALTGCDRLKFVGKDPATGEGQVSFSFTPSDERGNLVSVGSSPVGAEAHLHIDNPGLTDPAALATPHLKRAVIKLPEGLILNPSSANGLEACSEAQIGYKGSGFPMPNPMRFNEAQPACPDGSKIGTAEIKTPLLDAPLVGEVFLASQEANPFGSLLAVYLVVNDPYTGVLIKLPGEVQADPVTGRLTATFDNNPQLPFEDLYLHFRGGGAQSLFATSEVCGSYPTEGEFTPWSAPESGPPAQTTSAFSVTSNCAASAGARPFSPGFEAGTIGRNAGGYNPLVVNVERRDGEQELTSIDFTLPKGLIGKLAGIPYCSDAAIAAAGGKTGRQEQAAASCPAASQVGTVDAAAGVGPVPFHAGGKVYLAGPYKGAPVSTVAVVPAVAGPIDLGDVVVRAPLYIDHETAELTAKTDPIPTILKGIPLKIRSVAIRVDRPGFILNPTSCTPMNASATFGGGSGATAKASYPFQAVGCKGLKFAPKLKLALKGKTKRGGHPGVIATLTQPPGQANIGKVSVALPRSEFLEQGHIKTNCTRVQFAAEQCPPGSIYGHAEAITPLLDQPLTGPVYLRSSSHRLPDLAVVLKGPPSQPIEIDLDGRIDSFKGGIRTTFDAVPDAPVSKFVLRLPAGKKSLIVNSTNICRGKHRASVQMTGQNGVEHDFGSALEPRCGKKHKRPRRRHQPRGN